MIPVVISVDDDKVTQMLNQMILKRSGFSNNTITCMNGREALQFFEKKATEADLEDNMPALIFLDLNMPIINGWEFLENFTQQFAAVFPSVKVVVLSSTINPLEKEKALKNKYVIDFLCKPLTLQMIANLKNASAIKHYFKEDN